MRPPRFQTPSASARVTPQPLGTQPLRIQDPGTQGTATAKTAPRIQGPGPQGGLDRGRRKQGAALLGDWTAGTRLGPQEHPDAGRGTQGPDRGSARLGAPRGERSLRRGGYTWPVCVTFSPVGEVRTPKHLAPPGRLRVTAPLRARSLRKVTAAAILRADLRPRAPTRRRTRAASAEPAPPGRSWAGEARMRGAAAGCRGRGAPPGAAENCAPVALRRGSTCQGQGRDGGSRRCCASLGQ